MQRDGSIIFLCNYGSNAVTVIDLAALPKLMKPVTSRQTLALRALQLRGIAAPIA
jgi:hypothetical protein